jgi:hypothetical protein
MFVTKKFVFIEKLRCDALDILRFEIKYINKIYVPYEKTTRESDVSILKRLHLSDISCGT